MPSNDEQKFKKELEASEQLTKTISSIAEKLESFPNSQERFSVISEKAILGAQDLIAASSENVLAIQLLQVQARTEAAILSDIDLEPRDAVEIAKVNRRDWLNNRAALVNSWRAIEVIADQLESGLSYTFSGNVGNIGSNPLALHSSTGQLRVGLEWDAPITRLQERNNYRQVLIEYQRAKRTYYQFEDGIWASMRALLRTVRQNQLSFEIQRFAVQTATEQISVTEDLRQISETLGTVSGPTAARDAVTALNALLSTQSQLIGIFVNYESLRRNLDLDLGTMEIDAEGLWIDPGRISIDTLGGVLGDAILEYGLTEDEKLMRDSIEITDSASIEVAPSDRLPPAHSSDSIGTSPTSPKGQVTVAPPLDPSQPTRFTSPLSPESLSGGNQALSGIPPTASRSPFPPPRNTLPQAFQPNPTAGPNPGIPVRSLPKLPGGQPTN